MLTVDTILSLSRTPLHAPPAATLPSGSGVAFHSGRVRPGDIFFALPGASQHGLAHADAALAAGAVFVVSDRAHPRGVQVADPAATLLALGRHARRGLDAPVVAVSGSAGKTSTKALLAAALDAAASPGNFNTPLALACTLVDAWLAAPASGGARPLVLELGVDRPGEMAELVDLVAPTHGLLTVIAASHLEALGDLERVAAEKSRLLDAAPHAFASLQVAPYLDDRLRARTHLYGLDDGAATRGRIVDTSVLGQRLEVDGVALTLAQPGRAMADNAVGALAVARALGVPLEVAAARLSAARPVPARLERKRAGDALLLDDSYNSNPASAEEALAVLASGARPHSAVLGDMLELGRESAAHHRALGRATLGLDRVVAVGPMARHLLDGNPAAQHAATVEEAIALVRALPRRGTILVKASRGMRFERLVSALLDPEADPNHPAPENETVS